MGDNLSSARSATPRSQYSMRLVWTGFRWLECEPLRWFDLTQTGKGQEHSLLMPYNTGPCQEAIPPYVGRIMKVSYD